MNSGIARACRGTLTASIAVLGLMLCAAAGAQAQTETFRVGFTVDRDGTGSVSGTYTCPFSNCPPGPWTLQLERGGQVLGAATGTTGNQVIVGSVPQAGDVVRFLRTGLADVVVTYDGLPAFDDTSCAMLGRRAVSGTVAGRRCLPTRGGASRASSLVARLNDWRARGEPT